MSHPTLYIFTISHYCEKARWALDHLGIDYNVKVVAPGSHLTIARKMGLKRGSVPILQTNDQVIQGSDAIIDWAEQHSVSNNTLGSDLVEVKRIEQRSDSQLGVHIRRWFYSEAVIEHPASLKPVFRHDISLWEQFKFSAKWPVIRKLMIEKMHLGEAQGQESYNIVKSEIEWLESLIAAPDSFLTNSRFSRADVTAASLLAPIVAPPEHTSSKLIELPPRVKEQVADLSGSVIWAWVLKLYRTHRV